MTAVVVGAAGGIGRALAETLALRGAAQVHALSRAVSDPPGGCIGGRIDVSDESSIAAAAERLSEPLDLVIVATGLLHDWELSPERSLAELDPQKLAKSFAVNAIGPALVAKHFSPRLAKGRRVVFAALSARVGSIEDNRLGGWYGYRASKAALNMLIRSLAIELRRTRPLAVCACLHPGTVDTALSQPFQRNVAPDKLFSPAGSATHLLDVIDGLTPEQSGGFYAYDGGRIPF